MLYSKSAKRYDNCRIRSTRSHVQPKHHLAKWGSFLPFAVLIASLYDMFKAGMAGWSRFPVAWEAVQSLYLCSLVYGVSRRVVHKAEGAKLFWRVVLHHSQLVAPKCEI